MANCWISCGDSLLRSCGDTGTGLAWGHQQHRAPSSPPCVPLLLSGTGSSDLPPPLPQLLALLACCLSLCPSLCPHRHHVVLQLLQPCAALVTATAGGGQAVVGAVEGGRGGAAVIRLKGLMGAIAGGGHGSVGPCAPRVPSCPPPTAQHPPSHRAGASLQWGLAPTQGHPGVPTPIQGHAGGARLTRSCSSCSQHRSRMSHLCGSSRLGRESRDLIAETNPPQRVHVPPPVSPMTPHLMLPLLSTSTHSCWRARAVWAWRCSGTRLCPRTRCSGRRR